MVSPHQEIRLLEAGTRSRTDQTALLVFFTSLYHTALQGFSLPGRGVGRPVCDSAFAPPSDLTTISVCCEEVSAASTSSSKRCPVRAEPGIRALKRWSRGVAGVVAARSPGVDHWGNVQLAMRARQTTTQMQTLQESSGPWFCAHRAVVARASGTSKENRWLKHDR